MLVRSFNTIERPTTASLGSFKSPRVGNSIKVSKRKSLSTLQKRKKHPGLLQKKIPSVYIPASYKKRKKPVSASLLKRKEKLTFYKRKNSRSSAPIKKVKATYKKKVLHVTKRVIKKDSKKYFFFFEKKGEDEEEIKDRKSFF